MDDEPLLRNSMKEFLEACGYDVEIAAEGEEAVILYKKGKEMRAPFDVVIMDLTTSGGMGGKEAARQILAMDPKAKIIVSTKPFSLEELYEKVKRVSSQ
jgi:two-component system cell cycle sensor histidine kinase/response regulator CckA